MRLKTCSVIVTAVVIMCLANAGLCGQGGYGRFVSQGSEVPFGPAGIHALVSDAASSAPGALDGPRCYIVQRVEVGAPAHGLIKPGDVITAINGKPLPDKGDVRASLAYAIVDSEAADGKLRLAVNRGGESIGEVTVRLDTVPDFSPTWPFDCKRTDILLRNACDYLAIEQLPNGYVVADDGMVGPNLAGLLWLAMGEPRYLENAVRAAYWYDSELENDEGFGWGSWGVGYGGVLLAEYYQMTGDRRILPGLERIARIIARGQMPSGGWSHGFYNGHGAGYGEVNNTGMVCYMALLLAKECGVKVDEAALKRAMEYYEKFAPTLTNRYGDHAYEEKHLGYCLMNGKIGGLAVAHQLNGRPHYAAEHGLKVARSFDDILRGHTGPFFNTLWSPIAASQAPAQDYRRAMDQLGWFYVLARSPRGSLTASPDMLGLDYIRNTSTGGLGLGLAVPRRHLRILGAPRSVFVQNDLPAELAEARRLHQAKQFDQAIALVEQFLETPGLDPETMRRANELRDKSRYVREGIDLALARLDRLAGGGRMKAHAYEVDQMLNRYRTWIGEDDSRLQAVEAKLPEKWRRVWTIGKHYFEGMESLQTIRREVWWRHYNRMLNESLKGVEFGMAASIAQAEWTAIADTGDTNGVLKTLTVPTAAEAPTGWLSPAFDDSAWADGSEAKSGRKRGRPGDYSILRFCFDLNATAVEQLRISRKSRFRPGDEFYLNGKLVLKVPGTEYGKFSIGSSQGLQAEAVHLLREGRNVLIYASALTDVSGDKMTLEGVLSPDISRFAWTEVPGRDEEIRKLTATRDHLRSYYEAEKDTRTTAELMKVFLAEPYFMPDAYHALGRYMVLAPAIAQASSDIAMLLDSPSWGARFMGLMLIERGFKPINKWLPKNTPGEVKDKMEAFQQQAKAAYPAFIDKAIQLLEDAHPQVRLQAARVVETFGAAAKDAVPALVSLLTDPEGQNWWIRQSALDALLLMPLADAIDHKMYEAALSDPASYIRQSALRQTFESKDAAVVAASARRFKEKLIDQMFDAPHGMGTPNTRGTIVKTVLAQLSKDDLRPHLPRFFEALSSGGGTLSASKAVLVSFGDEVTDKLALLIDGDDSRVRNNALDVCTSILSRGYGSPELKAKVRATLTSIQEVAEANVVKAKAADDHNAWTAALQQSDWAGKLLKQL